MVTKAKTFSELRRERGIDRPRRDNRPGSTKRGYGYRWQKASKAFLKLHPLCQCDECKTLGRVRESTVVDHKIPHKGNKVLFWDRSNWQAMAKTCHDRKTATQDGGFGNKKRDNRPENPAFTEGGAGKISVN